MSIQEYLPEKSFFITIGGLVVGIALVLLVIAGIKNKKNKPQGEAILSENRLVTNEQALQNLQILETLDSDGDGLYDWEEALWGTSPMVADTDEDGISDFDEVGQVKIEYNLEANSVPQEELSQLDLISRDLYSTVAILGQQGKLDESQDQIMELFQEVVRDALIQESVSISDIILVQDSPQATELYQSQVRSIVSRYVGDEELDLTFIANSSNKTTKQQEALDVVVKYQNFFEDMAEVAVPVSVQQGHMKMLDSIRALANTMDAILYTDQDALLGASGAVQLRGILSDYYSLFYPIAQ